MLISLFSIFDPFNDFYFSNWLILRLLRLGYKKFFLTSNILRFISFLIKILKREIKIILKNFFFFMFFFPLFILVLNLNLLGLLPFVFPSTRHLRITLSLRLPLWIRLIIRRLINYNKFFTHLVPFGCPFNLIFLIVLIETISTFIRPLTLAIRLSANIIAGHMIIILIRLRSYRNEIRFLFTILTEIVITVLEFGVALIQPYVFFILLTLYRSEI